LFHSRLGRVEKDLRAPPIYLHACGLAAEHEAEAGAVICRVASRETTGTSRFKVEALIMEVERAGTLMKKMKKEQKTRESLVAMPAVVEMHRTSKTFKTSSSPSPILRNRNWTRRHIRPLSSAEGFVPLEN